jgi:hypothetical protein
MAPDAAAAAQRPILAVNVICQILPASPGLGIVKSRWCLPEIAREEEIRRPASGPEADCNARPAIPDVTRGLQIANVAGDLHAFREVFKQQRDGTVLPRCYRDVMAVRRKRSISMPPELDAEIAAAAADAGLSYSAWLADTARKEFTVRAGLAAVSQFEHDNGAFTAAEIADADAWTAQALERARQASAAGRRSA